MCEATTIAAVGVAIAAASAAYGVHATQQQQKAQNAAAEYQAKIYNRNAENANNNAAYIEKQGEIDAKQHRLKLESIRGSQLASGSASGALVNQDSNLDLTSDTMGLGELDALTIRQNAARDAWAVRNQAADYQAESALARAKKGSVGMATAGSALTGASNLTASAGNFAKTYKDAKASGAIK